MKRQALAIGLGILGAALLAVGLALIYVPAAFIALGGGLLALGFVVDFDPKAKP